MKRCITIGIIIVICFLLQCTVFHYIELAGVVPNLLLIVTMSFGLMRGRREGLLVGFFSGLLIDIFFGSVLGPYAFIYMTLGYGNGFFHRIYYSDDNILPLVLIGVNDLVYGVIMYILCGLLHNHLRIVYYLKNIILPEIVYTVAVGLVFYQILLRINDWLEKNEKRGADFV